MTMPSHHFLTLLGFNNHDLPIVEAATGHIMGHTVQVYMKNSQSFENADLYAIFWSGGFMSYVDWVKRANEGTVTAIEMDAEGHFKMCFIGFGVAIKSFLCYMKSLIIIDAAHLKGTYLGTNLVAVGMDGNN
ncbi:hypothetical protein Tco_1431095 [Tanacetum coccineum]